MPSGLFLGLLDALPSLQAKQAPTEAWVLDFTAVLHSVAPLYPQWQGSGDGWVGCVLPPGANTKPLFFSSSKTALLEGLEVDQYMWGILNAIQQ